MVRAIFDGRVLAESHDVRRVEGMVYFPDESADMDALEASPTSSRCFWKGKATCWHVSGDADVAQNAAFVYQRPWPLARKLVGGRVAFWRGVSIEESP